MDGLFDRAMSNSPNSRREVIHLAECSLPSFQSLRCGVGNEILSLRESSKIILSSPKPSPRLVGNAKQSDRTA